MTDQDEFNPIDIGKPSPDLPGDKFRKDGKRSQQSRWSQTNLKVNVTETDIDLAVRGMSNHCMIADAIKRQLPQAVNVDVDIHSIRWTNPNKQVRYIFQMPEPAYRRLVYFDRGAKPKPFSFWLKGARVIQTERDRKKNGTIPTRIEKIGTAKAASSQRLQPNGLGLERPTHTVVEQRAKDSYIGGRSPAVHSKSKIRKFGAKAFTWDEHDIVPYDPEIDANPPA